MAATIQLKCPACGKDLVFPPNAAGTISICGACGSPVIVPELPPPQPNPYDLAARPGDEIRPAVIDPSIAPSPGLLDDVVPKPPPAAREAPPVIPVVPVEPPTEPQIVRRAGPMPQFSPQSQQALEELQRAAAAKPPPPPLDPPMIPQNVPSAVPEFLPPPEAADSGADDAKIVWFAVSGAAVVVLIAVFIIWFAFLRKPPWDIAHRMQIEAMMQTADTLAVNHDYAAAWRKYSDIQDLVRGQIINDPTVQDDLNTVGKRKDEIYQMMIQPNYGPSPTATAPPSPTAPKLVRPHQTITTLPPQPQPESPENPQEITPQPAPAPVAAPQTPANSAGSAASAATWTDWRRHS